MANFNGYLIKLGSYKFPLKYIEAKSYTASIITQTTDTDTLANGEVDFTILPHQPTKVVFSTIDGLTNTQINSIMSNLENNYITTGKYDKKAKVMNAEVYIPEQDKYISQKVYLRHNMEFPIDYIEGNTIVYNQIEFAFTGI